MAKLTPLRIALITNDKRQFEIANRAGMHQSRLSLVVNGHQAPTEKEAKAIARALRTSVHVLFPDQFPNNEAVAS